MKYYLTAGIPYVNATPHIGHVLGFLFGDVLARFYRSAGAEVFYISGSDENSLKNVQAAEKEGISINAFCDRNARLFSDLAIAYDIIFDNFERTSSPEHFASSQELWRRCAKAGDIYKKKYKGLYCVGCEAFYTLDELNENGECFEHPGKKLDEIEEENYFFRLSKYEKELRQLLSTDTYKVFPEYRKNEVLGFLEQGLQDFSISRSKERAHSWGVPVPGDENQIMYVWFDALNVYRSAALPASGGTDTKWWPADLHIIGKGIIRFHAIYWPAILLSAKLALPKELFVHGYVTLNGQKISKSLGNTIDPFALVEKYGVDAVRYYLLREAPSDADIDFSEEKFKTRYNADLANGLGNFASRVLTLSEKLRDLDINPLKDAAPAVATLVQNLRKGVALRIEQKKFHEALAHLWSVLAYGDKYMNDAKPWSLPEESAERRNILNQLLIILDEVARELAPFLPQASQRITDCITHGKKENIIGTKKISALFPRL